MAQFEIKNLTFTYPTAKNHPALSDINLNIEQGEYVTVCGRSGSGKTTLLKHLKSVLAPHGKLEGEILFEGKNLKDTDLRTQSSRIGYVMQNPDNQIIASVVEEDVGFGPENMGIETKEIWQRVEESLKAVGMYEFRKFSPNKLSGGQKQRVSIAGVIAMHPKCIVLDEPTAMLDPQGRKEVIRAIRALNDVEKITVILITHYMEEVIYADKVYVMDKGKVTLQGTPREVFSKVDELKALRLDVPQVTLLAHELREEGFPVSEGILTKEEFRDAMLQCVRELQN